MLGDCLAKVNQLIAEYTGENFSELFKIELVAELQYFKRQILTTCMVVTAEEPLKAIESLVSHPLVAAQPNGSLLVSKYYIKALMRYDEYQLGVEPKTGYQGLLTAQRIN